tara:strand:- start:767 stop:1246 length:480 start_codon:yes stop_codon:yes gene_type:complete
MKDDMHFIALDNRVKKPNGTTYVVLSNGQEILLPPTITKVPALLLLNRGHRVLFGGEITDHLKPKQEVLQRSATQDNGEPHAFALGANGYGVASDNFSFLDQNADELAAKGNGGMRQQHHYASISAQTDIETPPDTYSADTIGSVSMEQLQQKRNSEIN